MSRASMVAGLAAMTLTACSAKTDLGTTCKMTKPCKEANCTAPLPLRPADVANAALDYIALGSAECDDLACIRTANSVNPEHECENGSESCADTEKVAIGYCTSGCLDESNCRPDFQGENDTLVCNQLLLSDSYLEQLRKDDAATFERVFGSGASANYCIFPRATEQ